MRGLSDWAQTNRPLVYFVVAALVAGGVWSAWRMPKLEDPEVKVKLAMVVTTYPGASAHEVELQVTDPLEKSIRAMRNVDNVESYSMADVSLIQVELNSTVPDEQVEQQWDMLRRRVAAAQLPSGAGQPQVRDDFGSVFGIFYALTGEGMTPRELGDWAELVQRELADVAGVDRVELYGRQQECIDVVLSQDRMAALGVTPAEVVATLSQQCATDYAGYYQNGDNRVRLTVTDKLTDTERISDLLLQGHAADQLRIADIATVERQVQTPVRASLCRDGKPAVGIMVAATSGTDIVKVGKRVSACAERLQRDRLPAGAELHQVFFQPTRVTDALGTFAVNLAESVAIVVLVLMLTMGLRSGIIIGTSLMVTVLGSFLFLQGVGGTLQRVSLGALILAMGMLVDNAIVILDGIMAGKKRHPAMPLLGATLIAIIAFLPIFLSPDTVGVYVRDLFVVLAVSLLLSWVLALAHVPLMAQRLISRRADAQTGRRDDGQIKKNCMLRASRLLVCSSARLLQICLRHRWTCVAVMAALVAAAGFGFRYVKRGFFPDMEYDQLYIEYKLPEGVDGNRVQRDLDSIGHWLSSQPHVTHVTASQGATPGRYNLVRSIANPSLAYGELIVDYDSPQSLVAAADGVQAHLSATYPDAYVKVKRYNLMFKKYPIEAQFVGPDPAVLHQLADSALAIVRASGEVCLPHTDWEPPVPLLAVDYNQPAARMLGLGRGSVSLSMLAATEGLPIGQMHDGAHPIELRLKAPAHPADAQVFSVLPLPVNVPLRQVSRGVQVVWEDPVVPRYNGQRSQRVQCSPAPGIETEAARRAIASQIEAIPLPPGYQLLWQGERAASQKAMQYLFASFPLAVILIVGILIMLFRDYRKPLVILLSLPTLLVGVVAVMLATGQTFNFVAIVGTLGLMGMLVKNGIVLVDEIEMQLAAGKQSAAALVDSARCRMRPVAMASVTTILGMVPLLTDAMFGSMAAAIMGGLAFGTVVTLLFVPVLYALLYNVKAQ